MKKKVIILVVCILCIGIFAGASMVNQSQIYNKRIRNQGNTSQEEQEQGQVNQELENQDIEQQEEQIVENENGEKNKDEEQEDQINQSNEENVEEGGTDETVSSVDSAYVIQNENAVIDGDSIYDCDIEADQAAYDGNVDIVVGDRLYATQINDWYMNFDQYVGKVVEIEGYYIDEYAPYYFVGRYGPSCPYCQGGYVCFEFFSNEDLTELENAKDWIKVTGILREGYDQGEDPGPFYYIEVLTLEKMDKVGKDTITN